jgi:hypothetical protein
MAGPQPQLTLHVQPAALAAARAAVEEALAELGTQLALLSRGAYIRDARMGDKVSNDTQLFYNAAVMDSPSGPLAALIAYRAELARIQESLKAMEEQYVQGEGTIAGSYRPRA